VVCVALLPSAQPTRKAVQAEFWVRHRNQSGGNVAMPRDHYGRRSSVSQTLTTDSDGAYVAVNLLPGTYSVRAEYKVSDFRAQNILVELQRRGVSNAVLQRRRQRTITITEEVPMVDTTSTSLGGTISNENY